MRMRGRAAAALGAAAVAWLAGAARAETPLERGTYLMRGIVACGNCHTPKKNGAPDRARELAGGTKWDEEGFVTYASNITPDRETGIGGWTDAQIVAAIREGRRPDGAFLGPPMPYGLYRGISDRDARAIVAYLRAVRPVRNKVPRGRYPFPLRPSGPPLRGVRAPDRADPVAYGAYLSGPLGHCIECHTPFAAPGRRDFQNRLGAGGAAFHGPWGTSFSANITPDRETGIGGWTDRQIIVAITNGTRPDGRRMLPPMAVDYYRNIRRGDLDAIVAYLRRLRPVRHAVPVRHIPPKNPKKKKR